MNGYEVALTASAGGLAVGLAVLMVAAYNDVEWVVRVAGVVLVVSMAVLWTTVAFALIALVSR